MEIECAIIGPNTELKDMIEDKLETKVVVVGSICPTGQDHFRIVETIDPSPLPPKEPEKWCGKGKRKMRRQM